MPDFGDDFGDSLKRFSSMFLRELFHQWLRDSQKNGYYHETIGGENFDVKLFDDDTQREIFEQKLREAGIEFTEKSVPAVRFNTKDRKAIEKIYQEVIKDIDTGTYTPNKKEAEFVASQPADAQTQYDLSRLADNGLIPKEELAALGRNYTMGDAMKMLDGHKEAKEQFLTERKYRDLHKEATQEVNDLVKNDPKSLDKPATRSQMKTLESAKEQGVLSDAELKLMGKDGLTVKEASFILDQHPEIAGKLNLSKGLDIDKAAAEVDKSQPAESQAQDERVIAEPEPSGAGYDMPESALEYTMSYYPASGTCAANRLDAIYELEEGINAYDDDLEKTNSLSQMIDMMVASGKGWCLADPYSIAAEADIVPQRYLDVEYVPDNADPENKPLGWMDFLEAAKGNAAYAMMLVDRAEWTYPSTMVDEDLRCNEVSMIGGKLMLTNGLPVEEADILAFDTVETVKLSDKDMALEATSL